MCLKICSPERSYYCRLRVGIERLGYNRARSSSLNTTLTVNTNQGSILDKKPLIYVWAPFYRFLVRIRSFFTAELHARLEQISGQLSTLEKQLTALESHQRDEWRAFEQWYLCFLSDPDRNTRSQLQTFLEAEGANQVHAPATDERNGGGQDAVGALSQACRDLTSRFAEIEAENRRRWEAVEELLSRLRSASDETSRRAQHS